MKKKFVCKIYHCYKYFQEPTYGERLVDVKLVTDNDYTPLSFQEVHRYFINEVRQHYPNKYKGARLRITTSQSRSNSVLSSYITF